MIRTLAARLAAAAFATAAALVPVQGLIRDRVAGRDRSVRLAFVLDSFVHWSTLWVVL